MIYLTTSSDGKITGGLGSSLQFQLSCYALSKQIDVGYYSEEFINVPHYEYYGITQEQYCDDINKTFKIPSDISSDIAKSLQVIELNSIDQHIFELKNKFNKDNIIVSVNANILTDYLQKNLIKIQKNRSIKDLNRFINLDSRLTYNKFNNNVKNISFHIRRYTKTDSDGGPAIRDLYDISKNQNYINILSSISRKFKNEKCIIRIYTQGTEEEFNFLKKVDLCPKHEIELHVEEYPITSLYYMINSDILIMANSSFSYVAHLIKDKITFAKHNFYLKTYNDTIFIPSDFTVI